MLKARQKIMSFELLLKSARSVSTPMSSWPKKIRTRARFLYSATNRQFLHPMFNRSEVIVLTNWQTNRRRWKHPPRSVMLRQWVNAGSQCNWNFWLRVMCLLRCSTRAKRDSAFVAVGQRLSAAITPVLSYSSWSWTRQIITSLYSCAGASDEASVGVVKTQVDL